ncbi:hypothetical protein KJS94_13785 [Flavihumibacter rivuli]|uniref:hypothetical protein n=1 Tax=Flavihumibacter rivuli TaxID=2838156 RepID=UPI001BDED95C|nr:hypothetical protein [Flavihumibacter rivuli]ULQ55715.1 hypothetical protein KJS94_13785 [Flavihumibacter rivuli]
MNYLLGEQVTYFGKWAQGFDLSRAMGIAPLFWHAIAHHVFIVLQLSYLFKVPYSDVSVYFFYSSLIVLVPMVWKMVSGAFINKCRMPASVFGRLVYVMFFPSLALLILLMYLSARILFDGGQGTGGSWTFVSEERYYLLPLLLILLVLIHWAFISGGTFTRVKYLVGLFLWGSLAFQVLHVGWMLLKSRRERAEENIFYSIYTGNSRKYLDQLKKAADKHDADMVLFTSDYSNMYHAAMHNIKLMRHAQLLNSQTSLTATRPSLLVFFTYREPNSAHQAFIDRYGFKKTATIDTDYNCYISFINPQ